MPLTVESKNSLLRLISERKADLFGEFSATITKEKRVAAWKEVVTTCKSDYGFDPCPGKDYTYVRDTLWPNMKRRTIERVDSLKKTGAAGGALNTTQELVLEILDKRSTLVCGLNVPETYETPQTTDKDDTERMATVSHDVGSGKGSDGSSDGNTSTNGVKSPRMWNSGNLGQSQNKRAPKIDMDREELVTKKLKLQVLELELKCKNWELQNTKLELDIQQAQNRAQAQESTDMLFQL